MEENEKAIRIHGENSWLSIGSFDSVDLPSFTVLIGVNGSGKTQLLQAIAQASVKVYRIGRSGEVQLTSNVKLLDQAQSGLAISGSAASSLLSTHDVRGRQRQTAPWSSRDEILRPLIEILNDATNGECSKLLFPGPDIWQGGAEAFLDRIPSDITLDQKDKVRAIFAMAEDLLAPIIEERYPHVRLGGDIREDLSRISGILGISKLAVTEFQLSEYGSWGIYDPFTPNIAQVIVNYRDAVFQNDIRRGRDIRERTFTSFDEVSFRSVYGRPPWELIDETLKDFHLNYKIDPPSPEPKAQYTFGLRRISDNLHVPFAHLSSGEKIIIQLALATLQVDPLRTNFARPDLILMDELDAALHPAMLRRWLTALQNGIIKKYGISVILATHSPITVAFAPEGSTYEMSPENRKPSAIKKQEAVDRLTAGLPMLSINYSARRQVFVESTIDVDHYSMLHDLIRPHLDLPRTLSFVGTSTKGGCEFVYSMVKHMEDNGNQTVYGIVDWDLHNEETGRVKVLAYGGHYAKDNVLLDPILVGALLIKNDQLALDPPVRFIDLSSGDASILQRVSDAVVQKIKFPLAATEDVTENKYFKSPNLKVRKAYQVVRGHDVEAALKSAWPMLQRYRSEGELITEIIRRVLGEIPALCPQPIIDIFGAIARDKSQADSSFTPVV